MKDFLKAISLIGYILFIMIVIVVSLKYAEETKFTSMMIGIILLFTGSLIYNGEDKAKDKVPGYSVFDQVSRITIFLQERNIQYFRDRLNTDYKAEISVRKDDFEAMQEAFQDNIKEITILEAEEIVKREQRRITNGN